jgi:hypothetical protein
MGELVVVREGRERERESYKGVRVAWCVCGELVVRCAGRVGWEEGHCGRVAGVMRGLWEWVARGVAGDGWGAGEGVDG